MFFLAPRECQERSQRLLGAFHLRDAIWGPFWDQSGVKKRCELEMAKSQNSYTVHRICLIFVVPGSNFGSKNGVQNWTPFWDPPGAPFWEPFGVEIGLGCALGPAKSRFNIVFGPFNIVCFGSGGLPRSSQEASKRPPGCQDSSKSSPKGPQSSPRGSRIDF